MRDEPAQTRSLYCVHKVFIFFRVVAAGLDTDTGLVEINQIFPGGFSERYSGGDGILCALLHGNGIHFPKTLYRGHNFRTAAWSTLVQALDNYPAIRAHVELETSNIRIIHV